MKLLDAAILSGVRQSAEGVATVLIGGDADDVDSVRDILNTFASTITHLGPAGSGMAAKVINNAVAHATMVILCEAGAMAAAWSIPRAKLGELFASQEGGLIRPLTHRFMERVLGGEYAGACRPRPRVKTPRPRCGWPSTPRSRFSPFRLRTPPTSREWLPG
jgi:3-hydroxyisobutyrate dehydrogenase-like beta-hydroxyacid dehydrogenase